MRALDGVDLEIPRGETFAIVGESGCGKSMTALTLMRLLPETGRVTTGSVWLDGTELLSLPESRMRDMRGRRIAMIFQEPATSLNPVLTVGRQIAEVLHRHSGASGAAARTRAIELLDAVGIADSARRVDEYPFQLSGGMKQRVMIALALAGEPELLVADEPTTALDVTIQAQVLDLLRSLQAKRGMSILLITHDLGVVAGMAHRVAVMYAGQIVEVAAREAFFLAPQHPYSRKLFAALPTTGKRGAELDVIPGHGSAALGRVRGLPVCRPLRSCVRSLPCRGPRLDGGGGGPSRPLPSPRDRACRPDRFCPGARGHAYGRRRASACLAGGPRPESSLSDPAWRSQAHGGSRAGGRRCVACDRARPHARPRWRIGLRQDDRRQEHPPAPPADRRRGDVRRGGADSPPGRCVAAPSGGLPDRVPGSVTRRSTRGCGCTIS